MKTKKKINNKCVVFISHWSSLLYTCYNVHQSVLFVSCVTCIIRCTFVVPRVILCTSVQTTNMSKFYKKITTKTWKFRKLYWKREYGHIIFLKKYTASFLCCIINCTTWHLFVCVCLFDLVKLMIIIESVFLSKEKIFACRTTKMPKAGLEK